MADSVRPEEFPSPREEKENGGEDVTMEDVATPSQTTDMEEEDNNASVDDQSECGSCNGGGATSSLAKFKAAQDLRIQTLDLPAEGKPRANSEDSSTGGVSDTKTPVPSSTGKKRRRRTAAQIDRKYPCTYPGCTKAYGSEGSLTQHQRLKHRNQTPDPQSTQANQSLGNFFLPLHRTPRSLPGNVGRPGSTRTVNIRPAGIDGLSLQPFDVAGVLVPEHDTISGDFLMPSPAHSLPSGHGQHLRARSNSMPVSFASPAALSIPFETSHSLPADCVTPSKPQSSRRSRAGSTPRTTAKPPLRRQKSRSKSESLNELAEPIYFQEDMRPPYSSRSVSDTASGFDFNAGPPYDWRYAIARANSESPPSSEDDRIDSEILSVLADYDVSDTGDSTLELMSSDSSFQTVRSLSSESEGALSTSGSLKRLDEEWLSHHDDTYLTTHLEKMSMLNSTSPRDASETLLRAAPPLDDMRMVKLEFGEDDEGQVAEGAGSFQDQFPGVSIDSFAITGVDPALLAAHDSKDGLKSLVSRGPSGSEALLFQDSEDFNHAAPTFKQEPLLTTANETAAAVAATSELAALATYGSCDMGQADYMDVDSGSYGPLQWKTEKHRPNASQGLFGATLDSIPSIFHDKHSGLFAPRETTFIMDGVDYAMEEPRLSSPVGEPGF